MNSDDRPVDIGARRGGDLSGQIAISKEQQCQKHTADEDKVSPKGHGFTVFRYVVGRAE
jgi:hypothetical protein